MNKTIYLQQALGLSSKDLSLLIGVTVTDLEMAGQGKEKLPLDKKCSLELLVSLSALATKKVVPPSLPESPAGRHQQIMEAVVQNERQQNKLVPLIQAEERRQKQQSTREGLLTFLANIKSNSEDNWIEVLNELFEQTPLPQPNSDALYSNRLKLKVLKYERRLLEQELQTVLALSEQLV
ncbi:hypothetical protein [Flavobacterium phycosphaerae]|uniref:hypothetical protein n=1 Tax=Flavobacterium phycosphaerae TaxID=2697515 RepID=UPI001389E82E|nr:hypothetical protein [Flavobacterium phycosphaerae]